MIYWDITQSDGVAFISSIYLPSSIYSGLTINTEVTCDACRGGTLSDTLLYANYYAGLYERLLLLSSDIETNAGPLSESEQTS